MKVISVKKPQSKVGGEMMKSSLQQQKSQHDTIIANILRLQFQYQQQHTSSSSYTHNSNTNQYSTRFSKLSQPPPPPSSSLSLSTHAPTITGPTKGQLPSVLENHNFTNAVEHRVTHDAILAYDAQLNSEADDLILYYSTL